MLRTARGVANITSTGASLFEDIKKERIRELSFEGFRLADLKRWGDAVVRRSPQSLSYIMKTPPSQFQELNVAAGDYRLTWPIPSYDILLNTNLKQNQGY